MLAFVGDGVGANEGFVVGLSVGSFVGEGVGFKVGFGVGPVSGIFCWVA
jgi:hypothetical protein